jgi:hypothetical protein
VKPVALQHAVVERREGIGGRLEHAMEGAIRRGPVRLMPVGLQQRPVSAITEGDLVPRRQRDRREGGIRGGQRGVGVVRRAGEPARQRQQVLALQVEDVLLRVIEALDREAVERQPGVRIQPPAHGGLGDGQQFRVEPRRGLRVPGKQDLHLLAPGVDGVVTLVFVVVQRGEVPHGVHLGFDLVLRRQGREELPGPL